MRSLKEEDGQAFLLADLQAEQKKETTYLLAGLLKKVRHFHEVSLLPSSFQRDKKSCFEVDCFTCML